MDFLYFSEHILTIIIEISIIELKPLLGLKEVVFLLISSHKYTILLKVVLLFLFFSL